VYAALLLLALLLLALLLLALLRVGIGVDVERTHTLRHRDSSRAY
jgi:hypothetical protein